MEIKPKELRLGNYVNFKYKKAFSQGRIVALLEDKCIILQDGKKFSIKYHNLQPIILTEQHLIDAGYQKMRDTTPTNYRVYDSKMVFYIRYGTFSKGSFDREKMFEGYHGLFVGNRFNGTVEYLHEMQNLSFEFLRRDLNFIKK